MIDDANSVPQGAVLDTDICVVGTGAAGLSIALQFLNGPCRVLVLEAGSLKTNKINQDFYRGSVTDPDLHTPPDHYRDRVYGGTTKIWGGRCVPFDPIDLEQRSWIHESGWPIDFAELAGYYPAANRLCEAGDYDYGPTAVPGGMRPLIRNFGAANLSSETIERFSCPTDFGARYRADLEASQSVRILLNANCTEIRTTGEGSAVESVSVQTLSGTGFTVTARVVVLATGGIETPRLLLASRRVHANGLGNAHDLVGRYYMCHMAGTIGALTFAVPPEDVWHNYERTVDGVYCRRRISVSAEAQRALGIGNVIFRLHHPRIPDPSHRTGALSAIYLAKYFISYEYSKRLHGSDVLGARDYLRHVTNIVTDPLGTAGFLAHWTVAHTLAKRKFPSLIVHPRSNVYSLEFNGEQEPNPDSRITLTRETDRLGMPRLNIDWRYTEGDIRSIVESLKLVREGIASSKVGRFDFDEGEVASACLRDGALGGHHIGTTRMSASPSRGVVDASCQIHGVRNLYIAGSAVFPTSSQANPTLTIVAMALRLANKLKADFATTP